jgi:hypothetical protein
MKLQQNVVLSLAALALAGCGLTATPATSLLSVSTMRASSLSVPSTKADFVKAVSALGVSLTDAQLATISADRSLKPNGSWAPRPAANLTADQNLQTHFLKHGMQFHPAIPTAQAYLAQAIALAEGKRGPIQYS